MSIVPLYVLLFRHFVNDDVFSEEEFAKVMGCGKDEFIKYPQWKQVCAADIKINFIVYKMQPPY